MLTNKNNNAMDELVDFNTVVYSDPYIAEKEFVITPIADRYGMTAEQVIADFDVDLLLTVLAKYDLYEDNRQGYMLVHALDSDEYWNLVEEYRN